jgi:hypothetical protein
VKRKRAAWRSSRNVGVERVVTPMKPTLTPARSTISYGGSSSSPSRSTVFAAMYGKRAPANSGEEVFRSRPLASGFSASGPPRRPPCKSRISSSPPSSNSWLPTVPTSKPISFAASIVGSSWNQLETSGVAPTMSPACTRIVRPGSVARSRCALSHALRRCPAAAAPGGRGSRLPRAAAASRRRALVRPSRAAPACPPGRRGPTGRRPWRRRRRPARAAVASWLRTLNACKSPVVTRCEPQGERPVNRGTGRRPRIRRRARASHHFRTRAARRSTCGSPTDRRSPL